MPFADRTEAGQRLAARLSRLRDRDVVVIGLPRGGVPVASEVARALGAPLDVIVVRKLGVPYQPELAMGAIGEDGVHVVEPVVLRVCRITPRQLEAVEAGERAELDRRVRLFRGDRPLIPLTGRTAVLVDDGAATGTTARAACRVARARGAAQVVLALPVAPPDALAALRDEADDVVCLESPSRFQAVGQWYGDFQQTADAEVVDLLRTATGKAHVQDPPAVATGARDHASRLVHFRSPLVETVPGDVRGFHDALVVEAQQEQQRHVGVHQQVRDLLRRRDTGFGAVHRQCSGLDRTGSQRHGDHRPHTAVQGRRDEHRPPAARAQVRHQHGGVADDDVHGGPLPQGELELLQLVHPRADRADRLSLTFRGFQRHTDAERLQGLRTRGTRMAQRDSLALGARHLSDRSPRRGCPAVIHRVLATTIVIVHADTRTLVPHITGENYRTSRSWRDFSRWRSPSRRGRPRPPIPPFARAPRVRTSQGAVKTCPLSGPEVPGGSSPGGTGWTRRRRSGRRCHSRDRAPASPPDSAPQRCRYPRCRHPGERHRPPPGGHRRVTAPVTRRSALTPGGPPTARRNARSTSPHRFGPSPHRVHVSSPSAPAGSDPDPSPPGPPRADGTCQAAVLDDTCQSRHPRGTKDTAHRARTSAG
ncbi:phosphoribosyltransferase [Lentzea sp. HUAS12]|uniref:phosphoribosyltransferase n=1 Tax=Lentzea sp. HUAS12 TaxID=2951806 RepID=UPI0035321E67